MTNKQSTPKSVCFEYVHAQTKEQMKDFYTALNMPQPEERQIRATPEDMKVYDAISENYKGSVKSPKERYANLIAAVERGDFSNTDQVEAQYAQQVEAEKNVEVFRKLALAVGYEPSEIMTEGGVVLVVHNGWWDGFDPRDELTVSRIAERHDAMQADIDRLKAERDAAFAMSKCECETNECCANLVCKDAEIDRLRNDAISALAAGGVLIRLPRVEGYEEVCDELLAADALEGINWPSYELITSEEAKGTT